MPRLHSKTKEDKEHKGHKKKKGWNKKNLQYIWSRYWEIIIAAIAGLIVGAFIVPRFFR